MISSAPHSSLRNIDIDVATLDDSALNNARQRVLTFIEHTLGNIIRDIQIRPCGSPTIVLKRIVDVQTRINPTTHELERHIVDREVTYRFPAKHKEEAWRFGKGQLPSNDTIFLTNSMTACVSKILAEIYTAIKTNVTVTKR